MSSISGCQCTLHALSSKRASLAIAVSVGPAAGGGLRCGDYARYPPKTWPLIGRGDSAVARSVGSPTRPAWSPSINANQMNQCFGLIVSTHARAPCTLERAMQLLDHHCCSFEARACASQGRSLGCKSFSTAHEYPATETPRSSSGRHPTPATPLRAGARVAKALPISVAINLELSSLLHVFT
jgi:hypothetical protein